MSIEQAQTGCVICTTERQAHVGYLCRGHHERLGSMLADLETEAAILSAVPSMQQRVGSGKGVLASERAPARLDVLVHTDRRRGTGKSETDDDALAAGDTLPILDVLHSWARVVREDRHYADRGEITISGERVMLVRNLDWVAQQPWVDECYIDLRQLLAQLKAVNGTAAPRKKAVGICPTLFDDGECGGKLWPDDERNEVICGSCDRIFGPEELRHLGEMLIRQGYVEIFRAEWFTGVPASTIRRWVSEGRLTIERDGRKLMVTIAEIEQIRDRKKRRTGVAS